MTVVETCELHLAYGATVALRGLDLAIEAGQVVALLGPNGAGKTTLTALLTGMVAPTAGSVRVLGADPRRAGRSWRARIGLVAQGTALEPQLTVDDVLRAHLAVHPAARSVSRLLELVDLSDRRRTRVSDLSGGQRRRLDLALGVLGRPELLLLDEPTTGLDPLARRRVWSLVEAEAARGATVLLTTHYLDEAQRLADRVVVLVGGQVVADDSPDRLRGLTAAASTVWCQLPQDAPVHELPPRLRPGATGALELRSTDVARDLRALLDWADRYDVGLGGLQVGAPSLEEAYLELTGPPPPDPVP